MAETLRILQREGAESFYTGSIAERIAADFATGSSAAGPLAPSDPRLTAEDLASYRTVLAA